MICVSFLISRLSLASSASASNFCFLPPGVPLLFSYYRRQVLAGLVLRFLGSRGFAQSSLQSPTESSAHTLNPFLFFFSLGPSPTLVCTAYTHCDLLCAPLILHLVTIPTFDPPTIRLFASDSFILPINRPFICTPLRAAAGLSVLSPFRQKPMSSGSWVLDRGHGHRHCNPSISAAAG